MRLRLIGSLTVLVLAATSGVWGQQTPPAGQPPAPAPQGGRPTTFRGGVSIILVDVDVRDKNGSPVRGLKASDFDLREDGKSQDIVTFAYEEITANAPAVQTSSTLANAGGEKGAVPVTRAAQPVPKAADQPAASVAPAAVPSDRGAVPLTSDEVAGHRVWVLLFDTSSMQPEEIQKAADAALKWAETRMSPADLVAVASISSTLQVLQDFTTDKDAVHRTLQAFAAADGTAAAEVDASTMASDEAANAATAADTTVDTSTQELDTFNNDVRLRGLKTICDSLVPIQQKKALLYFSSGMQRNGSDNQIEMRAATQSCNRANVMIDPVDSRGLQAVVPGGSGRSGSRGGVGAFSGRNVAQQFSRLASQQETLQALAVDTGGTAFVDSNDFGEAFDKVQKDISSYLHPRLHQFEYHEGRPVPRHLGAVEGEERRQTEGPRGILRRAGFYAYGEDRSRDPVTGTADDGDSGDRRAALRHVRVLPASGEHVVSRRAVRARPWRAGRRPGRTWLRRTAWRRGRVAIRLLLRADLAGGAG